jgi:hypothetical protein
VCGMHCWHTRASVWIATSFRLRPRAGHHRPLRHTPAPPSEAVPFRPRRRSRSVNHREASEGELNAMRPVWDRLPPPSSMRSAYALQFEHPLVKRAYVSTRRQSEH